MNWKLSEIADFVGGKVIGDPDLVVSGITNSENPKAKHITFAQTPRLIKDLEASDIACLIVRQDVTESTKPLICVPDPKLAWAQLLGKFYPPKQFKPEISDNSVISKSASIGKNVRIEAFVVIGENVTIGDNTVILSNSFIGDNTTIGQSTIIHPGVRIYDQTEIGSNVIIHANAVIGADGFGYVTTQQGQQKVPQVGNVIIQDYVELGANATIDRATIGSTVIGQGTKIDNMVQIGHNVQIGQHTVISAQSGISGSCKIGNFVTMGGKAGLGDHVEIGDFTMVGAGSGFPSGKKVPGKQIVFGQPARPYAEARKQIAAQLKSAETQQHVRELRKRISELESLISKETTK